MGKGGALFAGLALAALLLELGLRAAGPGWIRDPAATGGVEKAILCYGNSYTVGVGAPPGQSYCDHLRRLLEKAGAPARVENRGIAFSNSYQVLQAIRRDLARGRPALALVMTGEQNYANLEGFARFLAQKGERTAASRVAFLEPLKSTRLFLLLHRALSREIRRSVYFPDLPAGQRRTLAWKWVGGLSSQAIPVASLTGPEAAEALSVMEELAGSPEGRASQWLAISIARVQLLARKNPREALLWYRRSFEAGAFFLPLHRDLQALGDSPGAIELRDEFGARYPFAASRGRGQEAVYPLLAFLRLNPFGSHKVMSALLGIKDQFRGHDAAAEAGSFLASLRASFPEEPVLESQDASSVAAWIRSDYAEIARLLRGQGVPLLFQTYPPARDLSPRPSDSILRELAGRDAIPLCDTHAYFAEKLRAGLPGSAFFSDAFGHHDDHLSSSGYEAIAVHLLECMKQFHLP